MYEERSVKRGEIYSIGNDYGSESDAPFTRPGLIISSDGGNENSPNVIVAYLTMKDNNIGIHYGPTKATGKPSYIQCEYLATVSKKRLNRFMGRLSENEMQEVGNRLDEVLDLGYVDNTPLFEKEAECDALRLQLEELKAENAALKKKDASHEDELIARDVEIAVAKRMYQKAVSIIAAMRSEADLPERWNGTPRTPRGEEVKTGAPPKKKENPPKEEPATPKMVDINTAKFSVLRSIGFSNNVVLSVINGRPYQKIEDLKKVPGVNSRLYGIVEKKICCIPVAVEAPVVVEEPTPVVPEEPVAVEAPVVVVAEKVNVNTATLDELTSTGLNKRSAQEIISYRRKNGNYEKLEDLLVLQYFGNTCMKRYGHLLEV